MNRAVTKIENATGLSNQDVKKGRDRINRISGLEEIRAIPLILSVFLLAS
jgi:hypothetical protein